MYNIQATFRMPLSTGTLYMYLLPMWDSSPVCPSIPQADNT